MVIGIMSMNRFTFSVSETCENAMVGITNEIQVKKSPKVIFTIIEGCLVVLSRPLPKWVLQ